MVGNPSSFLTITKLHGRLEQQVGATGQDLEEIMRRYIHESGYLHQTMAHWSS